MKKLKAYPFLGLVEIPDNECQFCSGLPRRVFVVWFWSMIAVVSVALACVAVVAGARLFVAVFR